MEGLLEVELGRYSLFTTTVAHFPYTHHLGEGEREREEERGKEREGGERSISH